MWKNKNKGGKNRIHAMIPRAVLFAAYAFLVLSPFALWLASDTSNAFRKDLKDLIRQELVREDSRISAHVVDAVYVLGGPQDSLEFKFQTAAALYAKGMFKKILILSRPGITEYSSLLKRNLTNDEWAIRELEKLGVPSNSVEPVSVTEGFFGTLTEAKSISSLIKERGYKSLVLISSPYHAHRVRISFEKYLKDSVVLYLKGSGESSLLRELVTEYIKLKIYKCFLV